MGFYVGGLSYFEEKMLSRRALPDANPVETWITGQACIIEPLTTKSSNLYKAGIYRDCACIH